MAEAISKDFYNAYVTWTQDNHNAGTSKKVFLTSRQNILLCYCALQVRQWVNMWHSHLGMKATPKALVEVITKKKVRGATKLKDHINKEFQLD